MSTPPWLPPARAPFKIDASRVVVTSLRRGEDGRGYSLRLYNPGHHPDTVRITGVRGAPVQVRLSDVHGRILDEVEGPIELEGYEIVTLHVLPSGR
jgi:hypothetical protein